MNVSVEFFPPLTACTTTTIPYYFGKSYSINSTNNTFNLVNPIGCGNPSINTTNFFLNYPYVCSNSNTEPEPLLTTDTECDGVIKITGCDGECDEQYYIGDLYSVECS